MAIPDPTGANLTEEEAERADFTEPIFQELQIIERLRVLREAVDDLEERVALLELT